ncbi:hypothetical protein PSJ8397_03336 [Pseudooctadecabacter jejudonensis]|uniref:Uncharacterized protein n=1 Tax=Pseudooctadecabacter jejudonensis TaxID=1391910 RepID=A0A1Y5TIH9_9RHOB|nr:hypothetical protein PSJ8397_03336 [Pseudooctadecabacter jejudonensis]
MIFPMTGFVRLFGFVKMTVNLLTSRWNFGSLRRLVRRGLRATRCVGKYNHKSSRWPSSE